MQNLLSDLVFQGGGEYSKGGECTPGNKMCIQPDVGHVCIYINFCNKMCIQSDVETRIYHNFCNKIMYVQPD